MKPGLASATVVALLTTSLVGRASALVIALDPEEIAPKAGQGSGTPSAAPEAGAARATPVTVEATVAKSDVAVGESFVVEVKAKGPPGTSFTFPAELVTEAVELHSADREDGQAPTPPTPPPAGVHRYRAAVFELTEAKVPPLTVKYRLPDGSEGEATTEAVPVKVVSRLPKDADPQKIADVRGPLSLAIGNAFWITLTVAAAAAAVLVAWLVRRRRRSAAPTAAPVPAIDPAQEARSALQALVASGLLARGDHRGFYIALTAIAKRYLERRLGAPVLEMTTAEMVAFLRDSKEASGLVGPMRDLAGAADQIKFARGAGLSAEAERHTEAVSGMIATIEAAFAPPPPVAAEKVA